MFEILYKTFTKILDLLFLYKLYTAFIIYLVFLEVNANST